MHVAYVGNFEPPHSTENDVTSALETLGHRVSPYQEQHVKWLYFERDVRSYEFDLVLWTRTGSLDVADRRRPDHRS